MFNWLLVYMVEFVVESKFELLDLVEASLVFLSFGPLVRHHAEFLLKHLVRRIP
jgi:hypothetical protein